MQKLNENPILNELSYTKGLQTFHKTSTGGFFRAFSDAIASLALIIVPD